jgi:hypothetical protein
LKARLVVRHPQALYNVVHEINAMENKYLKTAVVLVLTSFLLVTIVFWLILLLTRS